MIDKFQTRRSNYIKCEWYKKNEDEDFVDLNEIRHLSSPSGYFWAKEVNGYSIDNQQVENLWMIQSNRVAITTTDNIKGMEENDIVKFDGRFWRVDSCQPTPKNTQRRYRNRASVSETTVIQLKG